MEGRRIPDRGDIGPLSLYLKSLKSMENPPADDIRKIEEIIESLSK